VSPAPTLFDAIGGTRTCRKLSKAFYARVERDPLLRPLFPGTSLQSTIEEFAAFLVQFLGGPSADSQRRQRLSLHGSHCHLQIGEPHRKAWLRHMNEALEEAGIGEPARVSLRNFFDLASAHIIDSKPGTHRLNRELARRWKAQRNVDEAVAAIRGGRPDRAVRLTGACDRAILPGLLAVMIGDGNSSLIGYVDERLTRDPALVHERYGGKTLLHIAGVAGRLSTVELLLRLGADPNALDGGKHTPLYCTGDQCAVEESADVVHALFRGGALVDAHDGVTGATPLHMAARRGNAVVARALLECGADIHARDRRGDSPLQRAINCKKPHVVELLRSFWRS
jgi:hemoglobin